MVNRDPSNFERLDSCKRPHVFRANLKNPYRWYCVKCGGEVSEGEAIWYNQGLEDSREPFNCPNCKRNIPGGCCPYCGEDLEC
jgi:hypothetical protein